MVQHCDCGRHEEVARGVSVDLDNEGSQLGSLLTRYLFFFFFNDLVTALQGINLVILVTDYSGALCC